MAEEASALGMPRPAMYWQRLRDWLPQGRGLPEAQWHIRHRAIIVIILAHAVALCIFGLAQGVSLVAVFAETAAIALLGVLAAVPKFTRSMRSGIAALALVSSSAVLTQFWGGVIEGHFHFFVVVALISLYQDWVPFLLAIAFVALDHGVIGTMYPHVVYNHADALAKPWKWAGIHAALVLAECVALIVVWRANETSREETDRILRSAGEGIIGIDAECRITFTNPAARRMLADPTGSRNSNRPLYDILVGDDGCPLFDGPGVLRRTNGPIQADGYLTRDDGSRVPVEMLCTPFEGRAHADGAVVAFRDTTERVRATADRARLQTQQNEVERLQQVSQFKTQFMNMAAHELNTPLTPIKMQLHLLKDQARQPSMEAHREAIQMLDRNFQRLSELVGEILDSSRLEGNRLGVRLEAVDLTTIVRQGVASFAALAAQSGVSLDCDAPPTLMVRADPMRVTQSLFNLLSNAMKFTPRGGRIKVRLWESGAEAKIEVQDTGIGMDRDQLARLFQPFTQVHEGQVAGRQGTGLGLYITRGIAQLHGGDATVESAGPGKGTTFTIRLPAHRELAPVAAPVGS